MKRFIILIFCFYASLNYAQINLPVDFELANTSYFTDFGGNSSVLGQDPVNASNTVAISSKTITAETWAGTSIGTSGLSSPIPFTATATTISVKIYSAYAGTPVHLKAEDINDATKYVETRMYTTKANEWETIVFDFNQPVYPSPPLDLNINYSNLAIFFNFGTLGSAVGQRDYYWDDVMMGGTSTTLAQIDLPVTFETPTISYALVDFENNSTVLGPDPVNPNQTVAISTKPITATSWAGTIVGTRNGFASTIPFTATETKISMRVYSPDANTPILLKAELSSDPTKTVETLQYTTKSNEWEIIEWNFLQHIPNTPALDLSLDYNLLAVFFNFGIDGATAGEKTYYWDNVQFGTYTNTQQVEELQVQAFPNPVEDKLQINIDASIEQLYIYSSIGQVVHTEQVVNGKNVFDIGHLPSGVYFVRIETKNAFGHLKIVKQ